MPHVTLLLFSMTAVVLRDVLQRPAPWWMTSLVPVSTNGLGGSFVLTSAQRRQVSMMPVDRDKHDEKMRSVGIWRASADLSPAAAQSMLTHGRFLRLVNPNRGDVVLHVDTADFLSCDGLTLTTVTEEVALLEARTRSCGFTLPFWVSEADATMLCAYSSVRGRFRCASPTSSVVAGAFHDTAVFVELRGMTSAITRYVNWGSLCSDLAGPTALFTCLSFFRCFCPINVHTRRRFDRVVEVRLRVEAVNSGCWCTIWGTAEDYAKCGFQVLDGALGVDVFDDLGNPAFLINALCTTDPLEVYAACYPNDSICTRHS